MAISRARIFIATLAIAAVAAMAAAGAVLAAPTIGIELTRNQAVIHRNDEFASYKAKVTNTSATTASCIAGTWGGTPAPALSYQWLRDGVSLGAANGAQTATYTPQAADTNHSLQCQVTGTNANASITSSATAVSPPIYYGSSPELPPPAPKEPIKANARPTIVGTGVFERTCTAPAAWKGTATFTFQWLRNGAPIGSSSGTATTASGSTSLSAITTATGNGQLTSGSKSVTGVTTSTGTFRVGQTLAAGGGIPAGAKVAAVGAGTLEMTLAATATEPKALSAGAQPFSAGDAVTGAGIPAGTTIASISGQTATLSQAATASASGVTVTATATGSKYKPNSGSVAGEEDENKILQCLATGTNASGTAIGISNNSIVGSLTTPPENAVANSPTTSGADWTSGSIPITVFFTFPEGMTLSFAEGGAGCNVITRSCVITAGLAPGASTTLTLKQVWIQESSPAVATVVATATGGGTASGASDANVLTFQAATPFGLRLLTPKVEDEAGADFTQAGGHPFGATATFEVNKRVIRNGEERPVEDIRHGIAELPPGLIGNPLAASTCPVNLMLSYECDPTAAVGGVVLSHSLGNESDAVYRIPAEKGFAAEFGFATPIPKFAIRVGVRTDSDYGINVLAPLTPQGPQLYSAKFTFCGSGTKTREETGVKFIAFLGCKKPSEAAFRAQPVVTMPTNCSVAEPVLKFALDSWPHPGATLPNGNPDYSDPNWKRYSAVQPAVTGCDKLIEAWTDPETGPTVDLQPDTTEADTPSGYTAKVHVDNKGLTELKGIAASHLRDITVTLPKGVSLNPAVGSGVQTCSTAQMGMTSKSPLHFNTSLPECPAAAKLGTGEITTPLLEHPLQGSVYLAAQHDNPFGSDYAIYFVVEDPDEGIVIKLAGEVTADPATGQVQTTFRENPQLPFEDLTLKFFGGDAAALANPATCGVFTTESVLSPWAAADPANPKPDELAHFASPTTIGSGPHGTPCASTPQERPLNLDVVAGSGNSTAGATSPFVTRIRRSDGNQELSSLVVKSAPGYAAYLRGVPACSQAAIAAARSKSGIEEQNSPSCPGASRLGSITSGAGAGEHPLYVSGDVYLAGPYKGAPLSIVTITPAVAGGTSGNPAFDLGNVVVQVPTYVDRATAQITAKTDALPEIVKGIPLRIRDIKVDLDRPNWGLNPTSCDRSSVSVTATGNSGASTTVSTPFQMGGCDKLAFAPKLKAHLTGATKRGKHPAFTAELTYPEGPGYANIKDVQVTIPHSEFLDQAHINTICTRPQAAANACPAGSIYGYAEAETPLIDGKLIGPVFLKSSDHQLPDLAIALRGPDSQPIEVEFQGRIDSIKGQIRNTIEGLPDVPVSKFVLRMKGGKKGLLVNSRDLCAAKVTRMTVDMTAQNNKTSEARPALTRSCKGSGKANRHGKHGKRSPGRRLSRLLASW